VETELPLSAADAKYVRELEERLAPPRRANRDIGKAFAALVLRVIFYGGSLFLLLKLIRFFWFQ
jgi:hypothetical protein